GDSFVLPTYFLPPAALNEEAKAPKPSKRLRVNHRAHKTEAKAARRPSAPAVNAAPAQEAASFFAARLQIDSIYHCNYFALTLSVLVMMKWNWMLTVPRAAMSEVRNLNDTEVEVSNKLVLIGLSDAEVSDGEDSAP